MKKEVKKTKTTRVSVKSPKLTKTDEKQFEIAKKNMVYPK